MTGASPAQRELFAAALAELGVRRLLLSIHQASFPSDPDEDVGAGSPGTRASRRLFDLIAGLGFTGVQLGPSGDTSRDNASPYDGTIFSRAVASIAKHAFAPDGEFAGLVDAATLAVVAGDGGDRGDHRRAHDTTRALVAHAWAAFAGGVRPDLAPRLQQFRRAHAPWLERDALYAALRASPDRGALGVTPWRDDDPARVAERVRLLGEHEGAWPTSIDAYAFAQMIAHAEHARVRAIARDTGLALYADLQVGFGEVDVWSYAGAFLPGYAMGAPPSRTNPEGQPWNYPVLDPIQVRDGGPARALVRARADKAFAEHDGVRIDHPHGLVCPWVYRTDAGDPAIAVRAGARLLESPDLPDHPALARHSVVRPDQLDRAQARHADHWVRDLTPAQIDRYALLFDEVLASAASHGKSVGELGCEVLSTLPVPLQRVLERHGLGRWCVFQKANLDDPNDVYRSENARCEDWVMLGNHDTASIFGLIGGWTEPTRARWARHLVARLALPAAAAATLASDPGLLAAAMLGELFASRAENVMVFFADLFGAEARFNLPGTIDAANWSMRLPGTFAARYDERLGRGRALDLPLALALGLRARGDRVPALTARLYALAASRRPLPAAVAPG